MSFWNTKRFKHLQSAWYRVLEAEGFKDIEPASDLLLSGRFKNEPSILRRNKELYYLLLSQALEHNQITDQVDRLVMTRLADGCTIKEITIELQGMGYEWKRHRQTIRYIKRKYETLWGIRKWSPTQMRSRRMKKKRNIRL